MAKKDKFDQDIERLLNKGVKAKVRSFGVRYEGQKYTFDGFLQYIGRIVRIREDEGKLLVFDSASRYIGSLKESGACFLNGFEYYLKLSYYSGMSALNVFTEYLLTDHDDRALDEHILSELLNLCTDINKAKELENGKGDFLAAMFEMMGFYKKLEKVLNAAPEIVKDLRQKA